MASITRLTDGKKAVQFDDHNRVRRTIRLGKLTVKQAERVGERIDCLVAARRARATIDGDTVTWLGEIADDLHAKLAGFDLCSPREAVVKPEPLARVTVGKFLANYLAMRTDVRPFTKRNLLDAAKRLETYLGSDRPLADVTALDADGYNLRLREKLAENTVRRLVSRARQFFAAAVRGKLIGENPFSHLKGLKIRRVQGRQAFIDRQTTAKLLDAAPDAEWRAIIALARFGGLRVPSELTGLRWADIDWTAGTMAVASPKTAHCGKASRVVPLFPELRPWLQEAFDAAIGADGALPDLVVPRAAGGSRVNLRQGLLRIIAKAGVKPWPKPFINMRASRATELVEHYPSHVACEWLGHTEVVADEHYRQTTAQHYQRAAMEPTGDGYSALQGALQQGPESDGRKPQSPPTTNAKSPVFPSFATTGDSLLDDLIPLRGVEPRFSD